MKREIKFRAWCESNKEMYYPDSNYEFWVDNNSIGFYPRYDKDELYHFNTMPSENEKKIVAMQYTGLKDKNGKEIYEGDICKRPSSNGTKEQMAYGVIEFYKGSFCFKREYVNLRIAVDNLCYHYADCEIIGNIYENPELLKP